MCWLTCVVLTESKSSFWTNFTPGYEENWGQKSYMLKDSYRIVSLTRQRFVRMMEMPFWNPPSGELPDEAHSPQLLLPSALGYQAEALLPLSCSHQWQDGRASRQSIHTRCGAPASWLGDLISLVTPPQDHTVVWGFLLRPSFLFCTHRSQPCRTVERLLSPTPIPSLFTLQGTSFSNHV